VDYAEQRYYSGIHGRFLTADPYVASAGVGEPGSWNRYAYVEGDAVNFMDPEGLLRRQVDRAPSADLFRSVFPFHAEPAANQRSDRTPSEPTVKVKRGIPGLASAYLSAINALTDSDCAKLFNTENRSVAESPQNMLRAYMTGTNEYGTLTYKDIGGVSEGRITAAITTGILGRTPQGTRTFIGADITINANVAAPWVHGYPDRFDIRQRFGSRTQDIYRAITLIHELGHAYNRKFGPGSSTIAEDNDPNNSLGNTARVYENCFE
jgi:uncharacterized protein RhaS with RHS repeats